MPLLVPGFGANCQFTRFIAGLSLWQNFGYPALLIAAVDLLPGLLQLPVKLYS